MSFRDAGVNGEFSDLDDSLSELIVHSSYCLDALRLATTYDNQKEYVTGVLYDGQEPSFSVIKADLDFVANRR